MCGIIGLCGDPDFDLERFDTARDLMQARGPDGFASARLGRPDTVAVLFGHRRLAIQDLTDAGGQPMTSANGRYVIVYNGEVYNAPDLRRQLAYKGVRFRSTSDTEVILEGFAHWGAETVEKLNGIFAFAIWDTVDHKLFAARDRVGIKPFYFACAGGRFAFASDARALRALGFGAEIDDESLGLYLCLGYVPAPRSIWKGIAKLDAGHFLEWSAATGMARRCYWSAPEDTDFDGQPDALEALIDGVVEEQLLSDVPVGLFLSGGLDSSAIAAAIVANSSSAKGVTALTIGFPENAAADESSVALRTARELGLGCQKLDLTGNTRSYYSPAFEALDEPLGYSAIVTQTAISRLASEAGLKVVLSGDGGDEVFGGYRWYGQSLHALRQASMSAAGARGANDIPFSSLRRTEFHRARVAKLVENSPHISHARSVFPALRPDQAAAMFPRLAVVPIAELMEETLKRHDAPRLPEKRRRQRIDLYTFCQDVVLPKVDRAGMASSVEARPPLLDHRIIEWALSRPISDYDDGKPKAALRRIIEKRGLGFLLEQPKRGFSLRSRQRYSRIAMRRAISRRGRLLGLNTHWQKHLKTFRGDRNELETLFFLTEWRAVNGHWNY